MPLIIKFSYRVSLISVVLILSLFLDKSFFSSSSLVIISRVQCITTVKTRINDANSIDGSTKEIKNKPAIEMIMDKNIDSNNSFI
ncbi:hypothetical protein [Clostridium sp. LIBA-8841]|uniref:hypothetical protein n=1 Tax=Clostridium sp. LIBA-8841 TaxID=2987530 RepID=UPI002AC497B3|nr:hypothetical protein [Clostridium sp. LIBA-8841]MDZ5253935.1 hypothetical protein [Clostridium sp. LIBA-8841]